MTQDRIRLYVIGAGGHGREVAAYIADLQRGGWQGELCGYLDDGMPAGLHGGISILGPIEGPEIKAGHYITAVGSNPLRQSMVERITECRGPSLRPWTLIHPRCHIGQDVEIGGGTCIAPGVVITTCAKIGRHCIVNVNASISHDCDIGDFVNINPGAVLCGSVQVGEGATIGAGAVVKERVSIGAWSTIGAGAVVIGDVTSGATVAGVPARVIAAAATRTK
jgi:acetyltransferase EpsM